MQATALIADDEPLLRAELRAALQELWPTLTIVAEAGDGEFALQAAHAHAPQIAFLDVHMPRLSGVDAAAQWPGPVLLVYLTAHEQYAVRAFAQRAVDYLVKPLDEERLADTVQRLQHALARNAPAAAPALAELLPAGADSRRLAWIKVARGNAIQLVAIDEVYAFRAVPGYTQVLTREGEHYIELPLCELEGQLDPARFLRVHRSGIVNLHAIALVRKQEHGRLQIELKDDRGKLEVSRARGDFFRGM